MFKFKSKKGFTLLEALVATSILMVAVAAPITIAQKGLSSATYSKNQMIASYLAQDAIEYIKNRRDENVLNTQSWLTGLDDCLGDNTYCLVDTIGSNGAGFIKEGSDKLLTKTEVDNFYGYSEGESETNFTRNVNIKSPVAVGEDENEALITVTVGWGTGQVIVKTLIYNY